MRPPRWTAAGLALALAVSPAQAGLGDVLEVIGKVIQADRVLWLLGDRGAERRFGGLMARFFLLTNPIARDRQLNAYVNRVFDRVAEAAPRVGFRYRIHVINDSTINAFALPGGTIFIHRGMVDFCASDDELAAVLGHEIAHVVHRHALDRLRRDTVVLALINQLMDGHDDQETMAKIAYAFNRLSFSRKNEDQSDRTGMQIALDAGYDPAGMTSLWERMHTRYGSRRGLAGFLSTHPSHEARVANTRKWLEKKGLEYHRTVDKSYDSRTDQIRNLVANASFEQPGKEGLPRGWRVVEGDAAALRYPAGPAWDGQRALGAAPAFGQSLMVASDPVFAHMFHTPRVLAARVQARSGRPRVYLGVAYLDAGGNLLRYHWPGGEAVQPEVGEWTSLRSPPLDPAAFPEGTERLEVRMYLGRITGGEVLVDDVVLMPKDRVDQRRRDLLPGGDFEGDADDDGIPDGGFSVQAGTWDVAHSGKGFASVRLDGPDADARPPARRRRPPQGAWTASLSTPRIPVRRGETYTLRFLAEGSHEGMQARIHWIGWDRQGNALAQGPPPRDFAVPETWGLVRDEVHVDPPPGTPDVAHVSLRIEAGLAAGRSVWLDDLEVRVKDPEVDREGPTTTRAPRARRAPRAAPAPDPAPAPPPPRTRRAPR